MNNLEKDQLAVKAFYYTKASELGFEEANKLMQYYNHGGAWVEALCNTDLYSGITSRFLRIKPTKITTTVAIWVQAYVEVEHEEDQAPEDVMGSADVYYCPPNGDKEDLGGNYTYATKDMTLVDRDELEAMYNQLTQYSDNEYIDSGYGDWFLLEDIKDKYNL